MFEIYNNSIHFFIIYGPSQRRPMSAEHSVCTNHYITEKEKSKDNIHKASFGNITVEKLPFLYYKNR
jgi:hypothetical protein